MALTLLRGQGWRSPHIHRPMPAHHHASCVYCSVCHLHAYLNTLEFVLTPPIQIQHSRFPCSLHPSLVVRTLALVIHSVLFYVTGSKQTWGSTCLSLHCNHQCRSGLLGEILFVKESISCPCLAKKSSLQNSSKLLM